MAADLTAAVLKFHSTPAVRFAALTNKRGEYETIN
jgi:hypothetical protein